MSEPQPTSAAAGDWRDIDVPALGEWRPDARVSVVLDGATAQAGPTVAALRAQSYPAELIDVIEPDAPREPDGEIVVLVAAGVEPGSAFVEAHARWHHAVTDAVSLGPLEPLGADGVDPLGLVADLTRDLTDVAGGYHLAAAEGTLAVRRELYREAGGQGSAPEAVRRLDLAHRLLCAGAVFVAEPEAHATGHPPGIAAAVAAACEAGESLELRMPAAAALIALPPFREPASPRRHTRAALVVNLAVGEAGEEQALTTIAGALGGRMGDIELRVQTPEDHPGRAAIAAAIGSDPRASLAPLSLEAGCEAPFQATVPPAAMLDPRTLADLHVLALAEDVGALHVTVPGARPQDAMIEVVATAAWQRSRRLAAALGEEVEQVLGRLYGERWVSGVEVSTRRHGIDEPQVTEHGPLAKATDLGHERNAHLRFRERADDLAERAANLGHRALVERLRARAERQAAERVEARLPGPG